jgi:hypothetical protein
MKPQHLPGLIVINLALLLTLAVLSFGPFGDTPANAQARARAGDYVMIAAQRSRNTYDTIYITDLVNYVILAVEPNPSRKELRSTGFRPITEDLEEQRPDR